MNNNQLLFSSNILNTKMEATAHPIKNTKIVATVGPASNTYEALLELAKAGVNVFRLNFSHGTHDDHLQVINHITYINEKYGMYLGILGRFTRPEASGW